MKAERKLQRSQVGTEGYEKDADARQKLCNGARGAIDVRCDVLRWTVFSASAFHPGRFLGEV